MPVVTRLNLPIVPLRHQAPPFEDIQVTDQLDPEWFVLVRVAVEQADRGGSFGFAQEPLNIFTSASQPLRSTTTSLPTATYAKPMSR